MPIPAPAAEVPEISCENSALFLSIFSCACFISSAVPAVAICRRSSAKSGIESAADFATANRDARAMATKMKEAMVAPI